MMRQMCKGDSQKWISSLKESQFGEKGRGHLYDTLFTLRHFKGKKDTSYLHQGSALGSLLCVYPTDAQLKEYDRGEVSFVAYTNGICELEQNVNRVSERKPS